MSNLLPTLLTGFPRQPYIVLGSMQSPGVATVRGLNMPREWKEYQPYGASGATLVYIGQGLSKFTVDIDLWLPEHFIQWNLFATVLKPPLPGSAGVALGIQHPIVNGPPHGIHDVVVEDVSQPVQDDYGKWTYTIAFKQWTPRPRNALSRPIAPIPAVAPEQPTAQDIAETRLQELNEQVFDLVADPGAEHFHGGGTQQGG